MRFTLLVLGSLLLNLSRVKAELPTSRNADSRSILPNSFIVQLDTDLNLLRKRGLNSLPILSDVLSKAGVQSYARETFDEVPEIFRGGSIRVGDHVSMADIQSIPGVKKVWPIRLHSLPKPVSSPEYPFYSGLPITAAQLSTSLLDKRAVSNGYNKDTFSPHTMTQVNITHANNQLGAGVKIGIIDSGVDYTNPILGGCFGPKCHISFGFDLVGDNYDGTNNAIPGGPPLSQCNEHGTHVTGIISALPNTYGFTGVAPAATVGMYRIFGCKGSAADDVILLAIMRAMKDKCDIITLSLGGNGGWIAGSATEILIDHLEKKNILVTVAAGNSGGEGLFFSQSPASTYTQFSIASVDNIEATGYNSIIRGNGILPILSAKPLNVTGLKVYFTSIHSNISNDACDPLPNSTPDLSNSIVIVQRGICLFTTKFANIFAKGGKNVLVYNTPKGSSLPYFTTSGSNLSTVGGLTRLDATGLIDTTSGGLISDFSEFGPTNDMYGQPTLAGPGGNILSTFPLKFGGVGVISGTSMSTPFIAGAAAVFISARRKEGFTPFQIRSIFTTTARSIPSTLKDSNIFTSIVQQGGGLIQLADAINSKTLISPNELLLNDSTHSNLTQKVLIVNNYSVPVSYKFSATLAVTIGTYNQSGDNLPIPVPVKIPSASASVAFSVSSITIQPGKSFTLITTFTPPKLSKSEIGKFPIYSGFINIVSAKGLNKIPYFGLAANVYDMPVLDLTDTIYGPGLAYPYLFDNNTGVAQQGSFTYPAGSGPVVFVRLASGTRVLTLDLVDSKIKFTATAPDPYDTPTNSSSSIAHRSINFNSNGLTRRPRASSNSSQIRFDSIKTIGNLILETDSPRDFLLEAADGGPAPPYSDLEFSFNGTYTTTSNNQIGKTNSKSEYRILIRALKNTGDPIYEKNYESWLSPPFKMIN